MGTHLLGFTEPDTRKRATHSGLYTQDGNRFWINQGDPLPSGAVLDPSPEELARRREAKAAAKAAAEASQAGSTETNAEEEAGGSVSESNTGEDSTKEPESPPKRKKGPAPENRVEQGPAETR